MVCHFLEEKCYRAGEQFEIPAYLVEEFAGLGFEGSRRFKSSCIAVTV